ncbi:IclR family transcriptional regulator [Peterkaempfera sp. SMS 1(5)a]|uniref:IclR family transcriptional regulator n=1 Tax=Peterkaempfera podocarpi TaxID=3232308 RepID=UPI00366B8AD8
MGRLVPAVVRALDILELFLDGDGTLSTPEITKQLDLPRTTVHELVTTLAARSYLVPVPEQPGKWQLGLRTYQLGSRYADRADLATEARAVAREVAARCGETVHVGVLDGTEVVYIAKVDSSHAVRMVSAVGRRLPAHCTAVGKMMLASLPEQELAARYPAGTRLEAMTPHTLTTAEALRSDLAETRDRGTSREFCESNSDVACVAAPVRDAEGATVAAMSVSVPTLRWSEERGEELSALVAEGAMELSRRLGSR